MSLTYNFGYMHCDFLVGKRYSPEDGVIAIFNSTRFDGFGFRGCRVVCKANSKRRGMGEMVVCVVLATVNHVWRNQYGELHFERLSLVGVGSMWRGLFVISCFLLGEDEG